MFRTLHRLEDEENELQHLHEEAIISMFVKHETEMKELKKLQKIEVEKELAEDHQLKLLRTRKQNLNALLSKLTSKPEILPCPECPVCYESMKPPTR